MKFIFSELLALATKRQERNVRILLKFLLALFAMITLYSVVFHFMMILEDRSFTWITGFYWTLTVMSTLGFGDITFTTDLGKLFSILVLMSGIVFLLTMLPFTFIQFLYLPWLEAQSRARAPRELPEDTEGHVILTNCDPFTMDLVQKLKQYSYDYVIVIEDAQKALEFHDLNYRVALGELGDPETYRRLKVEKAALVVANVDDMVNTNISFTVREISQSVPIVANADLEDSVDILELAGSTHVFQFMKMLGRSLARRVLGTTTGANVIGSMESLLIAEVPAMRTPLIGKTLMESGLRETVGINVVGVWDRGKFEIPASKTLINPTTVLLLAGSMAQLNDFDRHFQRHQTDRDPVLILGGGRVGRAAAVALKERGIDYRIIEKSQKLIRDERYIHGSAADINTLKRAGIERAPSIIITTHDDPTNIYLTIYCRRLRPDIQIISRANLDRNISKLHKAGADLVMSYDSMAVNTILNLLKPGELLMLAEGLNIFRVALPPAFAGNTLAETQIRSQTGCNVIAVYDQGKMQINPDPSFLLGGDNDLIMIGTGEAETAFFKLHSEMVKHS